MRARARVRPAGGEQAGGAKAPLLDVGASTAETAAGGQIDRSQVSSPSPSSLSRRERLRSRELLSGNSAGTVPPPS